MIVIVVGTAVGTVIGGVILHHYLKIWLRKITKKDRRYDLPSGE